MKSLEEMKKALADWRGRLVEENRASLSDDFWNEVENGDQTMYRAILAALELKITKGQIEQLSYGFEWKDKDELRNTIIPEQLARVLNLSLDQKCEDCSSKGVAALAALDGPSKEERERLWRFVNTGICGPHSVEDVQNQRELKQADIEAIRALILGNPEPGKEAGK